MKPGVPKAFAPLGLLALAGSLLLSGACKVGPNYQRPTAPVPAAYKEAPPPASPADASTWQPAQPSDSAARGKWWEIYHDPQLNSLEAQVAISNQNVLAAEAQFREARYAVLAARSALFPTVTANPSISWARSSNTLTNSQFSGSSTSSVTIYNLPFDLSWQADLFGGIRRSLTASANNAQASFAQLENARLTFQAELALDYFGLHGTDGEEDLLQTTVKSYQEYLQLTKDRFASGVASGADVAQAQTQLETARAQLIDYGVARAQFEHAIAVLTGTPPAALSMPYAPNQAPPPPVPAGVPSVLLERRPDIAAAERQMAAQNEQIGIAKSAFYPALTLSGAAGFESADFVKWLSWPSRFWSVGGQFAETLLDFGRRRAQVNEAQAGYDASVANYRQTVLTAFQQVEDNLAALRVLESEAQATDDAVRAARQALDISTYQYKAGTVDYLSVITEQTILLQNQVQAVNILTRRLNASVLLVEALGGGWDSSTVPAPSDLIHGK